MTRWRLYITAVSGVAGVKGLGLGSGGAGVKGLGLGSGGAGVKGRD